MSSIIQAIWTNAVRPFFQRPRALQLAALCHRVTKNGKEVLLVSSSSGRWILPKGWPIDGLSAAQAAQQEAWEEGGVKSTVANDTALGSFLSHKTYETGLTVPCETKVFALDVNTVANDFPEVHKRERVWVSPSKAATMVDNDGLKSLLEKF